MKQNAKDPAQILQLGIQHHRAGRLHQAEECYRQILDSDRDNVRANHMLGVIACQSGSFEIGAELIRRALRFQPDDAAAHKSLGKALKEMGQHDEAAACFRRAIDLQPDYAEAYNELGIVLHLQGQKDLAVQSLQKAISLNPNNVETRYNLGSIFYELGLFAEAVNELLCATRLRPAYAEAHNNLGNALRSLGRLDEAMASFQKSLAVEPDSAEAHNNIANLLNDQGLLSEAAAHYRKAIALKPEFAEPHCNLGNILVQQVRLIEALDSFRRAIHFHFLNACSSLVLTLNYLPVVSQAEIYTESCSLAERYFHTLLAERPKYSNSLDSYQRLRIGYLSPDFRDHSVAYFIEPVLKAHDREVVEVFCYANVKQPDDTTARIAAEADHWHTIVRQTDAEVAEQVKRDNIDILVDLAGHTGDNRLPVFARKPAPVQVSWIGYPNTTGLRTIDYRFTDAVADPQGETDRFYTEKLVRLEHGFLCYQPEAAAPEVGALPCLEKEHVTFGSFNNLAKVRPEVVEVWARILHAVPSSRLLLKAKQLRDEEIRKRYLEMFTAEGIAPDRIEMLGMLPRKRDHLGLYNRVDIGLDPFPYSGTTTTCEALWMGVPVVTLAGNRHAGRVGASLLHRIGLDGLVAGSMAEYVSLARSLAEDTELLQELRCNLRERLRNSNLMDSRRFTRHLEDVYRDMWRKYCHNSTRE